MTPQQQRRADRMEKMSKLLPCPFCGGTKLSICETESSWNDPPKAYAVSCASADCHGNIWALGYHLFETREKAIAAWNTRAKPTGGKDE